MKREAIGHTKMRRLCRTLGIELYSAIGIMEAIWLTTSREAPAGDIGKLADEDIADAIGWKDDPGILVEALVKCGWIDPHPECRLIIHDWFDHADDTVHVKLARARKLFADGRIPKLSRLPKNERAQTESDYEEIKSAYENFQKCSESALKIGPVPVPVPVPVPLSAPRRESSGERFIDPASPKTLDGQPLPELATEMRERHPKKAGNLTLVEMALEQFLHRHGVKADEEFRHMKRAHLAMCRDPDWTKQNGKYAPKLAEWIADDRHHEYHARDSPDEFLSDLPRFEDEDLSQYDMRPLSEL